MTKKKEKEMGEGEGGEGENSYQNLDFTSAQMIIRLLRSIRFKVS